MSRIDLMTCKGVNDEKGKRHPFPHQNHHHLHHYTTAAPPATAHAHISETCKCKNPSMWCAEFMASFLSVRFRFSVFLYPFWSGSVILVILFSQHSTSVVAITVKTFNNVVHIVWSKVFFLENPPADIVSSLTNAMWMQSIESKCDSTEIPFKLVCDSRECEVHCVYFKTWLFIRFLHHFIAIYYFTMAVLCIRITNCNVHSTQYVSACVCGGFVCTTSIHIQTRTADEVVSR